MATDRYYFFPTLSSFVQGVILFLTITLGFFQILETLEQTYIFNTFLFCAAVNTVLSRYMEYWNIQCGTKTEGKSRNSPQIYI